MSSFPAPSGVDVVGDRGGADELVEQVEGEGDVAGLEVLEVGDVIAQGVEGGAGPAEALGDEVERFRRAKGERGSKVRTAGVGHA